MTNLSTSFDLTSRPKASAQAEHQGAASQSGTDVRMVPDPLIRQPDSFRQSDAAVQRQRSEWCQPPSPSANHYLVIKGARVPVSFPTVCFDQEVQLRADSSLRTGPWITNLLDTVWTGLKTVASPSGIKTISARKLLEPARIRALWTQGNMQLCAVPRQDPTGAHVNALVLHWDGCNSSAHMYGVLRALGLSAHLLIDSDATVYQMMDLAQTKAFHAGWINERSIGIEFNNPVDPTVQMSAGTLREIVEEELPHHDRPAIHLDFTSKQKERLCEITDILQMHFDIPRALPPSIDEDGFDKSPGLMPRDFEGVCGHYHIGTHKVDPGLTFWPVLRDHWKKQELNAMAISKQKSI